MNTIILDELVARYGQTDAQIKSLKKTNDADKEQIKDLLADSETQKWTAGGFTVSRVVSTTETMNEGKLLNLMRLHRDIIDNLGIIKTMEYVDTDALESAIYEGKIPNEILQAMGECKETKTTVALRCTKAKEG